MASWKLHEKWCTALGVKKETCKKINKIIDSQPHDIVNALLKWGWLRDLFESCNLEELERLYKFFVELYYNQYLKRLIISIPKSKRSLKGVPYKYGKQVCKNIQSVLKINSKEKLRNILKNLQNG